MNFASDAVNMAVSVDEDFGDAPATYDPAAAASHVVGDLKLGSTIDADNTGTLNGGTAITPSPNAVAAGADNTGANGDGADEDAISTFPTLLNSATTYSLTVPISGSSQAGQVCGWVDYNRNGTFDTGERACASFAAGATSVTLNWTGLSGLTVGTNYVRLRASYDTTGVQTPTGRLDSGEVEDYRLTISPAADLSVTKTNSVTSVNAGGTTTYTVRVTNNGPSSATGAVLTDAVVSGLNVTSVACSGTPGQCTAGTTPTVAQLQAGYALPALASGQFYELTVSGTVSATSGTIANTATVAAPSGITDPDTANNSATDTDTINPPDLTITKTHTGTWTQADLNRTYTLTVTNTGSGATSGTVTVTDTLPTGLNAYRISGTGWTCTLGTLTCTRSDSLAPGASYPPITLVVDVDTNAPASVTNSASVSGGGETNTANNTATDPTSITATATGTQNCSVLSSASPTSLNFSGAGTLVSGTANTQGAVYRFSNVATGVDALVTVTNLSATSATLLQGGLSALLTTSSSAFVDYKVDLVQAGTSTPITPIDVVAYSFDIDGVGVGNPLSDYAQFTGANSVFLNSPTRLTLTGLLAAQSATYVGYNDTVNDPRNAAGGVYLDVNSFTLRAGVQGATSSATRGINFDLKTSNSSSFTLINCSDQTAPRTADLSVTKTDGVTSVNAAGTTTYTVTVSNAGPNSTTATLTDPAVTGLTKTGVTCTAATGGAVCPTSPTVSGLESGLALGKIPSGATLTFSVTANVTATSGSVSNTVTVAVPSTTIEPSTANNSATDTDTVTPVADLSVTKTDGVSSVNASGTTTYTIRVTNAGPSSVTGATLTDAAVAGLTVTSVACSGTPGQCSAAPTTAQLQAGYALPALASGQFYELTVTGTVTATGGSLANTATVAAPSGTTDPSTANNTATDTDTVTPVTDVAVSKTVNVVAAGPGGTVTYTIRAWNNGPSPAGAATLTDTVSASLTGVTWTCAGTGGATCSAASGSGNAISVTVNLGTDTGSATTADTRYVTLTVTGTLVSSATGTLGNTASVSDASDSTPANNTASVSTRVVDAVNDTGSVTFNQGATFTILANDTVGGAAATTSNATLPTIVTNGGLTGLSVNASGQLVLAASALNLPGTYTVTYQICDATLTTACDTATIAITVTPAAADLAVTKAQRAGTSGTFQTTALSVVQGGTVQYQIVVTNNGPSAVTNAPFTDAVPANLTGLSVVSATGTGTTCTASFTGSTLNGSFSGASGTSCTVTIQGTATTTGTFTNSASVTAPSGITDATTGNNTASVNTTVTPAADLAIDKSGPVAVGGGGTVSYTIRVWNNGPSSVTGATVTDSLPSGFTVTGISCAATGTATCGTQTFTASSVSITTGTLSLDTNTANAAPDGNFLTYTLTGTAPASGTLSNTASVAAPAGTTDPTAANNTSAAAVTRVVDAVNDATVNLAFGTGGTVTVLGNDTVGGAAATTANVAVTVQNAGGITGLTVNASGQLVVPAGTPAGSYTVTYQICDATVTTACDAATVAVNVGAASADLTITKTGPAFAKPGETITYTLTVTNAGPNSATGVTVSDTLPTGLTYVSSAPAATVSGQTLSWTLGTLAASASQTITVTATAPVEATLLSTPATRTLTNTASVSSATTDPTPANNTATAVTQMVAAKLTKSVRNVTQNTTFGTSGGGLPGEVLEYCIAFENIGGAPLPNFVVTDHVPGTTNAQTGGYDAEEASAATGFGVKLTRGTTTPTTSYFTSAADADVGALSSSGGTFGRGTMTVNLGALTVGDQGSVCFRTAIR